MLHPLRQLEILCQKQGRKLDVRSEQSNGVVQAHVFIDCILLGTSQNKERNVARRLAAFKVDWCVNTPCILQNFFPQCFVFVVLPIFSVHLYFTLLGKEAYFPLIYKLFLSCWVPSEIKDVSVGSMVFLAGTSFTFSSILWIPPSWYEENWYADDALKITQQMLYQLPCSIHFFVDWVCSFLLPAYNFWGLSACYWLSLSALTCTLVCQLWSKIQ